MPTTPSANPVELQYHMPPMVDGTRPMPADLAMPSDLGGMAMAAPAPVVPSHGSQVMNLGMDPTAGASGPSVAQLQAQMSVIQAQLAQAQTAQNHALSPLATQSRQQATPAPEVSATHLVNNRVPGAPVGDEPPYDPNEEKWVVLHEGIGHWHRCDVVGARDFAIAKSDVGRLLRLGAVRSATMAERKLKRVTMPTAQLNASYEQQITDLKKVSEMQAHRQAELEAELSRSTMLLQSLRDNQATSQAAVKMVAEKDGMIDHLRQLNLRQSEAMAAMEQHNRLLMQENHDLRNQQSSQRDAAKRSASAQESSVPAATKTEHATATTVKHSP